MIRASRTGGRGRRAKGGALGYAIVRDHGLSSGCDAGLRDRHPAGGPVGHEGPGTGQPAFEPLPIGGAAALGQGFARRGLGIMVGCPGRSNRWFARAWHLGRTAGRSRTSRVVAKRGVGNHKSARPIDEPAGNGACWRSRFCWTWPGAGRGSCRSCWPARRDPGQLRLAGRAGAGVDLCGCGCNSACGEPIVARSRGASDPSACAWADGRSVP